MDKADSEGSLNYLEFIEFEETVISKVNLHNNLNSVYSEPPCFSASGTISFKPPCSGGSSFSGSCNSTAEAAHFGVAELALILRGSCGARNKLL